MAEVQRKSLPTEADEQALAKKLSTEKVKSPEISQEQEKTKKQLQEIKAEIEAGRFWPQLFRAHLEALGEIENPENKAIYLGSILTALNKNGLSISKVSENGEITLKNRNKGFTDPDEGDSTLYYEYSTILKNNFGTSFTKTDLQKALLYRSSFFDKFLEVNTNKGILKEWLSTEEYVLALREAHPEIKSLIRLNDDKSIAFSSTDETSYISWKSELRKKIVGTPEDLDFLIAYFDDRFYSGENRTYKNISWWSFKAYQKTSEENRKILDEVTSNFTADQLYAIGVKNPSELEDFKKNIEKQPVLWTLDKMRGWIGIGIIWALLWLIFGKGFKGKLGFAIAGFFWGSLIWANTAIAGELMKWHGKNAVSNTSNAWAESGNENQVVNSYYSKINFSAQNDATKKQTFESIWFDLTQNHPEFVNAPTSILSVFETSKTFEEQKNILKNYGITLTQDNKENYKTIFWEVLKQKQNAIWNATQNEKIGAYLERTQKNESATEEAGNTTIENTSLKNGELFAEKKSEILTYFWFTDTQIISDFTSLWLDPFVFLNNYKEFIETKLGNTLWDIKKKIIESISMKLSSVWKKINELKEEEMDEYKNLDKFSENRWIINEHIQSLFEQTNTQVLPGAFILANQDKLSLYSKYDRERLQNLRDMFQADLTDEWDFDKTFSSFEIIDANTNNWNTFDTKSDEKIFKQSWWDNESLKEISLLNEKDKEIDDEAGMWYMAGMATLIANDAASFTGVWTIPWAVIWAGYGLTDTFKDEDLMVSILKSVDAIPEEYRTSKEWYDNALAFVWAIPLAWQAVRWGTKAAKVAEYISRLSPEQLTKFEGMQAKISDAIKSKFSFGKGKRAEKTNQEIQNPVENNFFNKSAKNSAEIFEQAMNSTRQPLIKSLLPKKAWDTLEIWDKVIKKTPEWKFDYNGKKYDKVDDILPDVSKDIKDTEIIAKINEWGARKLDAAFHGIVNKDLKIWENTYRFSTESWKKILQVKDWNGWKAQSIDELNPWDAQILLDTILWKWVLSKIAWQFSQKMSKVKIDDVVSEKEKSHIIAKYGKSAWEKISQSFNEVGQRIPWKSKDKSSHVYGPERYTEAWYINTLKTLLMWAKWGTYKTLFGWLALNEWWEIYEAGGIDERYENFDIYSTDSLDLIFNAILFKKVALWRALIYQTILESEIYTEVL